jgi:hypothetical protein
MPATRTEPGTPDDGSVPSGRRRTVVIVVVAVLVVVAIVVAAVLAQRGGADAGSGPASSDGPAFPSDPSATSTPVTSQDPDDGQAAPSEAPPVALDATAEPVPGVVVSVGSLAAVDGTADGPGEVAGPAVSFTVTVDNGTDEAVSLASTVITVTSGSDLLPADPLATGTTPLPTEVARGESVTGTFVFTVPVERRDDVRITFDYLAGTPAVVFAGAAPRS